MDSNRIGIVVVLVVGLAFVGAFGVASLAGDNVGSSDGGDGRAVDSSGSGSADDRDTAARSDDAGGSGSSDSDTSTGQVDSPPISVAESQVPEWSRPDRPLTLSLTVTGSGDVDVQLHADVDGDGQPDRMLAEQEVTVTDDGSREVVFEVADTGLSPGEYPLVVTAANRTVGLGTITVLQPPTLAFEAADTAVSAVRGQEANATATVTNDGDYGGPASVELRLDRTGDGNFTTVATETRALTVDGTDRVRFGLPTDSLDPGEYTFRLVSGEHSRTGTLTVLAPPTFEVSARNVSTDVTRGTAATVSAAVRNTGDVAGNGTVSLTGPDGEERTRDVSLDGGDGELVEFDVDTAAREGGNYTYTLSVGESDSGTAQTTVRVREPFFEVSDLRGNETLYVGDPMVFAANVTNTGDAAGTATVAYRIDLDDDDRPETDNITQQVTLAPGEETAVQFRVPYLEDPDPLNQVEDLPTGTYIYGVYTSDSNETSVFEARSQPTPTLAGGGGGGGGGGGDGSDSGLGPVSRDEISQEKYGLFYAELSSETRSQIDEIYKRQPFADDLGIVQVLTREEIARQEYGLDVKRGDRFDFTAIDVELQQQIEADFDAQFTSDTGDRIRSWDEIARDRYGTPFDGLNATRQSTVEQVYREQFDS